VTVFLYLTEHSKNLLEDTTVRAIAIPPPHTKTTPHTNAVAKMR